MDIALTRSLVQIASANTQAETVQSAQIAVLKKAINLQASAAAILLDALPQPSAPNLGPLGTQVDTFA